MAMVGFLWCCLGSIGATLQMRGGHHTREGEGAELITTNFANARGQWPNEEGSSRGALPATSDAIIMETANVTGWGSLIPHLEATQADVVCIQEHKVLESDIPKCREALYRKGWRSIWAPAC